MTMTTSQRILPIAVALVLLLGRLSLVFAENYAELQPQRDDSPHDAMTTFNKGRPGNSQQQQGHNLPPELDRRLEGETGPYVYSKMSAIAPDPLLTATDSQRAELEEKYGRWRFWDGEEELRPSETDYAAKFEHRDIPGDELPEDAWQEDAVFVNHILNDGEKLVSRAMEAIFSDYGRGKPLPPEGFAERARMFHTDKIDLTTQTTPPEEFVPKTGTRSHGGWTTDQSYEGLVRRLLHAMHTNDEFVVVLGGDAASAGHGNHFRQAYVMQFHRIMAPILARMGVKLVTRNMAIGHGLGTIQSTLGFSSLFGQDIDVLIWDSSMTEQTSNFAELFFRQGLMSGGPQGKIPFCMVGANSNGEGLFELLRLLHNDAGVDVGQLGTSTFSVPATTSKEQAETLPEPFRYVICEGDANVLCKEHRHCTQCWIDRDDIPDPKAKFPKLNTDADALQHWWYPSYRHHSLMGRNLAYFLLDAMQDGIERWSAGTMGGPPLDDAEWHMTDFYQEMKGKVLNFLSDTTKGDCNTFTTEFSLPPRICSVQLKGATEHTPRPAETSISSLVVGDNVPVSSKQMQYEGQDVHNKCFDPGNVDVVQVVTNRRNLMGVNQSVALNLDEPNLDLDYMPPLFQQIHRSRMSNLHGDDMGSSGIPGQLSRNLEAIEPGKGWAIHAEIPGECNGEYLSICGRDASDACPLLGYHDSRGEMVGNDGTGWLVLNLPEVKEGIVMIKYAFYESPSTTSNRRHLRRRELNSLIPDDANFAFEFAIDGQVTSWTKAELLDHTKPIHKRLETVTLLDKADFTVEAKTVQVAIRVKGCGGQSCLFSLSHIYWA